MPGPDTAEDRVWARLPWITARLECQACGWTCQTVYQKLPLKAECDHCHALEAIHVDAAPPPAWVEFGIH